MPKKAAAKRGRPRRPKVPTADESPSNEVFLKRRLLKKPVINSPVDTDEDELKVLSDEKIDFCGKKSWIELYARPNFVYVRFFYPKEKGVDHQL